MSVPQAPTRPFQPLEVVPAGLKEPQRLRPTVDERGVPVWQAGDTNVQSWPIKGLGWSRGPVAGRQDHAGLRGLAYVSDARVVVVSGQFAEGGRYRAYGIGTQQLLAAAATKVSQIRARHGAAGTFLVGQMRLPWLTQIAFGLERGPKAFRGEVRLCGQQADAFGDPELALLILSLEHSHDTIAFVSELAERVRNDRCAWQKTTAEQRARLDALPPVASITAKPGELPSVPLAGGYRVTPQSAAQGVHSARSFQQGAA